MTKGYAEVVYDYRKAGWKGTIPLTHNTKSPVPTGFTGGDGAWPNADQIKSWARGTYRNGNIALRMPENVIALDVDEGYKGKNGQSTIDDLEAKWGKLPPTFTSGSRPVGGHRFYTVPEDANLPGQIGPSVEILQYHHRYSVVWPSLNPDSGEIYTWKDKDGAVIDYIPSPTELPPLPPRWVEGLQRTSFSRSVEAKLNDEQVLAWLGTMREGEPCSLVARALNEGVEGCSGLSGSRHDSTLSHVWGLLGLGAKGHSGVQEALDTLQGEYISAVGPERQGGPAEARHDYNDMVARGVKKRASVFEEPQRRCGCDAVAGEARGQIRFAKRFASENKGRFIWVKGLGWLVWDGRRWVPEALGETKQAVMDTLDRAKKESRDLPPVAAAALMQDVLSCTGANQVQGIITLASSEPGIAQRVENMDGSPTLFNTVTGVLDLESGRVLPHSPDYLMTKLANGGAGARFEGSQFDIFLKEVLPDAEVRCFVQRLLGYSMLGEVRDHVLPIFTGTGSNGKGTLLEAVKNAFGDYAMSARPDILVDQGSSHPTEQADLFGRRLAITSETDEKEKLAASTVKRLTGGDTIRARFMRENFFEFEPSHTIIMMTNFKPDVSGDDAAMWRRLLIVPFDVVVGKDKMNTKLPKLLKEEASAVLSWAAEGYRQYEEFGGLNPPEAVLLRTKEYREEVDPIALFLEDRVTLVPSGPSSIKDVYQAYQRWCGDNGETPVKSTLFRDSMIRHGYVQGNSGGRHWAVKGDPKARVLLTDSSFTQGTVIESTPAPEPDGPKAQVKETTNLVVAKLEEVNEGLAPVDGPVVRYKRQIEF